MLDPGGAQRVIIAALRARIGLRLSPKSEMSSNRGWTAVNVAETLNERERAMNTVKGQVVVKDTGIGIRNLLISVYDVDPRSGATDELLATDIGSIGNIWQSIQGDRLGSVLTDEGGNFELPFEDSAFQIGDNKEERPDLILIVTAPEESGVRPCPPVLHVSCGIRQNAGRIESFLIRLTGEQLEKAGVSTPSPSVVSSTITKQVRNRLSARTEIRADIREIVRTKLESERKSRKKNQAVVRDYVRTKATAPFRKPDGRLVDTYVADGEKVSDVNRRVMKRNLTDTINQGQLKGHLDLNEDKLTALNIEVGDIPIVLSKEQAEALGFGDADAVSSSLHRSLIEAYCRDHTMPYDKCGPAAGDANGDSESDDGPPPTPTDPIPATLEDFKKNLSLILDTVTQNSLAPHHHTGSRPAQGQIRGFIHGLELTSGPADVPALFDFESLHIAFEHTWHQLFDSEWESAVSVMLSLLDGAGGNVEDSAYDGVDLMEAMGSESRRLAEAYAELGAGGSKAPDVLYSWYDPFVDMGTAIVGGVEGVIGGVAGGLGDWLGDWFGGDSSDGADAPARPNERVPSKKGERDRFRILDKFMGALDQLKNSDYKFTEFGAQDGERAVNFGVIVTYRQRWEPLTYQAGELVKTIPLAPKEARRFKSKRITKKSYVEKRSEASESKYNTESQETLRDISKIVRNAKFNTSFALTTEVGGKIPGIGSAGATSTFQKNFERSSVRSKESFREAVRESSQEFKNSNKLEVTASEEEQFEFEESGEISNPNEELAMTCLFYELQRRYRVSEHIHRLNSVILVAQEIPKPSEINDQWIICHDWILRRVVLDDSFLVPLEYVSSAEHLAEKTVADDLEANMEQQQALVSNLEGQLGELRGDGLPEPRGILQRLLVDVYDRKYSDPNWRDDETKIREVYGDDVAQQFIDRRDAAEDLEQRVARASTALEKATAAFHEAYREYARKMIEVHRLRLHIKQNILYYMQAIWDHELPDQRAMRLQNTQVPIITGDLEYSLRKSGRSSQPGTWEMPLEYGVKAALELSDETLPLSEVADLSNPLGYFGNYVIFPMNEPNLLNRFMMAPYLDGHQGISDPDDFGNYTLSDLDKYVCCLKERLDPETFETLKPGIDEIYKARLADPRPDSEEIVVPTESLFIEILPSSYSVLENFKLQHRAVDVQKAVAEVVGQQLENLRLTGRLITDQFGDPDTEKVIIKKTDDDITVDTG